MGESTLRNGSWLGARPAIHTEQVEKEEKSSRATQTRRQQDQFPNGRGDSSFPSRICLGCTSSGEYAQATSTLIFQSPQAVIYS